MWYSKKSSKFKSNIWDTVGSCRCFSKLGTPECLPKFLNFRQHVLNHFYLARFGQKNMLSITIIICGKAAFPTSMNSNRPQEHTLGTPNERISFINSYLRESFWYVLGICSIFLRRCAGWIATPDIQKAAEPPLINPTSGSNRMDQVRSQPLGS